MRTHDKEIDRHLNELDLLVLLPDGVEVVLPVSLELGLEVCDLRVQAPHPLLHSLQHRILLLKLSLDVIIDLDQDPILIIHMAKSLTKNLQPLLSCFLLLQSALLEIIVPRPFTSIHQKSLQLPQPGQGRFYQIFIYWVNIW